tara:strand:- start:145 stop:675 length:531 start_codon:yes stop_codon:yes gene_type:complete
VHEGYSETSKQRSSSEKNLKEVDLLENANKGDPKAQYNLGLIALASSKKKDINRALNWFNLAAIKAFPPAQYSMGVLYDKGLGVTENKSTALLWYYAAAQNNYAKAQYNLGVFFLKGIGTSVNLEEANLWFSKAARQGIKQAAKILATPSRANDNGLEHFNQVKSIEALGLSENEK